MIVAQGRGEDTRAVVAWNLSLGGYTEMDNGPAHPEFAPRLIAWQQQHGRHDLPWQANRDPYPVWVSEIMLQQTQVETVIPYFRRFMTRFPDVAALAGADPDRVMELWSGLGYYARARNLHAAARRIMAFHDGVFPRSHEAILALPGVGRSTAAAIASLAYGECRPILDGNVRRVFCRVFGVEGWPGAPAVEAGLWRLAEDLLPADGIQTYTQGLMDLGATVCTRGRPRCDICPMEGVCIAARYGRQGELPAPRPRKALPVRDTTMLVLLHAGEVLLEKRPPVGIWGGLWSLPECGADEEPGGAALRLGCRVRSLSALPALVHSFSLVRLVIAPWRVDVERRPAAEAPGRLWLPLHEATDAALPTPVRRLLAGLAG